MELLKIAFRNLFRNRRRSLLTIIISFLSVLFLVAGSSFLGGLFGNVLNESIRMTGHLRLTSLDYDLKERILSLTGNVPNYAVIKSELYARKYPEIRLITGRLKFGAVVFKGDDSKEGLGYGIESPDLNILGFTVLKGRIMDVNASDEIMIGSELAKSLQLSEGNEVTLLTRTLYNSTWALNFKVVGIVDLQNGRLNKSFFIPLPAAQNLLDMNDRVSEVLIFGDQNQSPGRVASAIVQNLNRGKQFQGFLLKRWDEIGFGPLFTAIVKIVSTVIQLIIIILAGLGIVNTMLMAIFERKYEIGLLKSMGMRDEEVTALFTIEGTILGLTGTFFGIVAGGMIAYNLSTQGIYLGDSLKGAPMAVGQIIYGVFNTEIFVKGLLLGITMSLLASFIPAAHGTRLNPTQAMRR